jgi:hypothetical protein
MNVLSGAYRTFFIDIFYSLKKLNVYVNEAALKTGAYLFKRFMLEPSFARRVQHGRKGWEIELF